MSGDLDVGSISRVPGVTGEQRKRAMLAVSRAATGVEDCRLLLYALGLLPDPEAKPRRKGRAA